LAIGKTLIAEMTALEVMPRAQFRRRHAMFERRRREPHDARWHRADDAELEVVVDPTVAGEKALRVTRRLEALHLSLSSSCRLVRHLSAIVEIPALTMLDAR